MSEGRPEVEIQNEIIRTFGTRPDMRIWRAAVGTARYFDPRTRQHRTVRFGLPGQADVTGILPCPCGCGRGVRLEIEVKREVGGVQSVEQKRYQQIVERFGGIYVLARSVDDVWAALKT